jgi:hypothetical protein
MSETLSRTCALSELLPGECTEVLHSHHVMPISYGGDPDGPQVWVCSRHHPRLEAMARRELSWRTCKHRHRYAWAKAECEARLNAA